MGNTYLERYIAEQKHNHFTFKTRCWNCGMEFFVLYPIHMTVSNPPTEEDKKRLCEWDALRDDPPRKTTVLCNGCGKMTAVAYDSHWLAEDTEVKHNGLSR